MLLSDPRRAGGPVRLSRTAAVIILFGIPAAAGCASLAEQGDPSTFRQDVGTSTRHDVLQESERLLLASGFQVRRQDTDPRIFIETHWRDRAPFQDEEESGVVDAQSRIVIVARPRTSTGLGELYAVEMQVENRVRRLEDRNWVSLAASAQYREWAGQLVRQLRSRLDTGVRTFDR